MTRPQPADSAPSDADTPSSLGGEFPNSRKFKHRLFSAIQPAAGEAQRDHMAALSFGPSGVASLKLVIAAVEDHRLKEDRRPLGRVVVIEAEEDGRNHHRADMIDGDVPVGFLKPAAPSQQISARHWVAAIEDVEVVHGGELSASPLEIAGKSEERTSAHDG